MFQWLNKQLGARGLPVANHVERERNQDLGHVYLRLAIQVRAVLETVTRTQSVNRHVQVSEIYSLLMFSFGEGKPVFFVMLCVLSSLVIIN